MEFISMSEGRYDANIEIEFPTSVYEFDAIIPEIIPVSSNMIYATSSIRGIRITIMASKIERDSNFNFDRIFKATGLTP